MSRNVRAIASEIVQLRFAHHSLGGSVDGRTGYLAQSVFTSRHERTSAQPTRHRSIKPVVQNIRNEMLHHVLSDLHQADLLATSLVSHPFYRISLCLGYKEPYLSIGDEAKWDNITVMNITGEFRRQESLALFLRTLLARGGQMCSYYVGILSVDLDVAPRSTAPRPGINLLPAALPNLGFHDHHLTEQGPQIILVLRLLPCLKRIELRAGDLRLAVVYLRNALLCPESLPIGLRNVPVLNSLDSCSLARIPRINLVALLGLAPIPTVTTSVTHSPEKKRPVHYSFRN